MFTRRVSIIVVSSLLLIAAAAFAGGAKEKAASSPSSSSSSMSATTSSSVNGGTLDLGGSAATYINATFNPFSPTTDPGIYFVYQSLEYVNPENGVVTPLLATGSKWSDNNLKFDVTLNPNATWNDGTPFTAQDVAFTFDLLKKFPALDLQGIWAPISELTSVDAVGQHQVVFTFSKPNVPEAFYILRTPILPEHIWSAISDPVKFKNSDNPVGTGPFVRTSYSVSNNVETFSKNTNYWQSGEPYVGKIRLIGQVSNEAGFLQMRKGETVENDIAIEEPQREWVNLDPQHNLLFWPVYGVNVLFINTAVAPFNDVNFRKAIDLAINKHMLEQRAYFGTGGYNISQTAVIPSQRPQWYDPSLKSQDQQLVSYDPAKALQVLESAGYKKTSNGLIMPDGSPVPTITLLDVSGDTDYITMAQVISQELKDNLGIPINVVQETYSTYKTQLVSGNFQLAIGHPPIQGPSPYFIYDSMFYSGFAAPVGQNAISNYDRYTNPTLDKALEQYGASSDPAVQQQAMHTIEKIMLNDIPTVVLTERTGFDLYNSTEFVGWPSIKDPYSHGWNGSGLGMELVVLKVHKR